MNNNTVDKTIICNSLNDSETFYMFGDNDYQDWKDLLDEYTPPPYTLPR